MKRGDGNLYITINDMGHGDATIISLPNGRTILIDFGAKRWDGNFFSPLERVTVKDLRAGIHDNIVFDSRYLLNRRTIDVLILTHSDEDHHKELQKLLTTRFQLPNSKHVSPLTPVKRVFFSGEFQKYGVGGTNTVLANYGKADLIYSITINEDECSYQRLKSYKTGTPEYANKTAIPDEPREGSNRSVLLEKSTQPDSLAFVKILDGTKDESKPCGFYLLASNVSHIYQTDNSSPENRGSIVSMILYGDKKFLFLGDATFNTEIFLKNKYGDNIKDVELVQVAHHASERSSNSEEFVRHIDPKYAVVSAAYDSGPSLGLPRYEVLARFASSGIRLGDVDANLIKHPISCYKAPEEAKRRKTAPGTYLKTKWDPLESTCRHASLSIL